MDYNGKNTNGGVLKAASTAQGAVVIDAQGSNGGFVNKTTAEKEAIVTGKNGTWQIYSTSTDNDNFGDKKNLDSETDAQWTSKSNPNTIATTNKYGKNPVSYSDASRNKFIFQATPVITLYSDDYLKNYGDEVTTDILNGLLRGKEVFTGLDKQTHNVPDYSSAFQEKGYKEYIAGEDTVTIISDGSAATATRNGGKYEATDKSGKDGKNAVYDLTVKLTDKVKPLDGYAIDTEKGKLEIKKRPVTITSSGEQTYGDSTYTSWSDKKSGFANDDDNTFTYEHGIKSGSGYETSLNKTTGRTTADASTYDDSVSYSNLTISGKKNADGTDDTEFFNENYTFDTVHSKGSIKVNRAPLHIYTEDVVTPYGIVRKTQSRATGLTNGDEGKDAGFSYDYGDYGHGYLNGNTMTNQPGSYPITTKVSGLTDDLINNYDITIGEATLYITPLKPDQTTHYVEGAHRPQDKIESALPVFRVDAEGTVKQYGTYGIENKNQAVTLSPTGMRMPEPNQTSTQDRKYMTSLKTPDGQGTFRLEYNGVVLRVIPVDPAAEQIVEAGDKLKNVALSEQALHVAYTQMGLDLVNLKGVYIYMAPM